MKNTNSTNDGTFKPIESQAQTRRARIRVNKLKQEVVKLKALIRSVEWVHDANGDMYCPWCCYWRDEESDNGQIGHPPHCPRQLALGKFSKS